jgi:hypothetical protein
MTSRSRSIRRAIFSVYLATAFGVAVLAVPFARALEPALLAQSQGSASAGSSSSNKGAAAPAPSRGASAGATTAQAPATEPSRPPFDEVDRNKDGFLDKSEAAAVPGLSANFERVDTNRDGKLDRDEFEKALNVLNLQK